MSLILHDNYSNSPFTDQFGGEMSELDDAGTYFDLGPKKVTQRGTYHYMCSRNNNFTNRSQKGKIIVQRNSQNNKRIGWNGGELQHEKYVALIIVLK